MLPRICLDTAFKIIRAVHVKRRESAAQQVPFTAVPCRAGSALHDHLGERRPGWLHPCLVALSGRKRKLLTCPFQGERCTVLAVLQSPPAVPMLRSEHHCCGHFVPQSCRLASCCLSLSETRKGFLGAKMQLPFVIAVLFLIAILIFFVFSSRSLLISCFTKENLIASC